MLGAMGEPSALDPMAYLADADAELTRLAEAHWYAHGLDWSANVVPWVLGHDHVRAVLRDRNVCPRSFTDDMVAGGLAPETAELLTPLFRRTGDEHRRHRALLSAAFTPRQVDRLRPATAAIADRLAADLPAGEEVDVVADFSARLPAEVFALLFGLPVADSDRLAEWGTAVAAAFAPGLDAERIATIEQGAAELGAYAAALIDLRRAEPTDDLVTHLATVEVDGERLDDREVAATVAAFIFAGSETTKRQLGELLRALADHPDLWERAAADPGVVPGIVEEVLRHHSIIPALTRVADEPFDHDGLHLDPEDRLLVSIRAANHDPGRFPDPERFDADRANASEHLTFGWGPHVCLGAPLARMELQESLRALASRFGPPTIVRTTTEVDLGGADDLIIRFEAR